MSPATHSPLAFRLLGQVPTLVVLAALAAVGVWGLTHDWKLSSGEGSKEDQSWCAEHNVPKDICVTCNPDLMPRSDPYGWCRKHGVHECPLCHPDVAQLDSPYVVTPADLQRVKSAIDFAPRAVNGSKDKLHERLIQFASLDAYDRSGVEVAPAFEGRIAETAPVHGEITHDPGRVAHVSSRAAAPCSRSSDISASREGK